MRKIIISLIVLLAAISLNAQSISGIRIDGGNSPILVYIGGNQMCLPTTTCFIANLKSGYYTVEVYATRVTRPGERTWKGQRLYNERVYFDGVRVKDIIVNDRNDSNLRPDRPDHGDYHPGYDRYDRVMSERLFQKFFEDFKKKNFESDRITFLTTALANADFTSGQCLQLMQLYTFDSEKMKLMKMMYPRIVDKQAFFMVIDTLTFSSSKDEMDKFIRGFRN